MRYKYKVREWGKEIIQDMEAMSLKKLQKKLDHKKLYRVEYINKKGNEMIAHITGIEPKWK